ncbi:MAG: metallophosphoesterase [Terriglobales bacterium]
MWRNAVRALAIVALTFLIVTFADRIFGRVLLPRTAVVSVFFAITQLWILSSMFAYLLFKVVRGVEYVWFAAKDAVLQRRPEPPRDVERRTFFRYAARLAAAVPIVAAVYGYASERFRYEVYRQDIPIPNLPPALDGFRIVQISDIHAGDFMPRYEVARAVDIANTLGGDVALVTGDFITGHNDPLAECIEEIARLRAPLGVWGCNGNHEIYAEAEDEAQLLFQKHGMKLLRQERTELEWRGAKLNLIGVDYQRDHMVRGPKPPMLAGVETLVRQDMPNILLSHNPNSFYKAVELGIELSLAGHTHGGQVNVEILDQDVNPAQFITKFIAGLYRLPMGAGASNSQGQEEKRLASLYVNRGLGTIGLPARLGVDPEISLLTLRRA